MLTKGLALWRGPVLADFADELFVQVDRTRLEKLRLAALEDRLTAEMDVGRHALVVAELEELAVDHLFRERLHGC